MFGFDITASLRFTCLMCVVCLQWRSWTWNTFEYPWTSKFAQIMAFISLFMVVVSTFTFVLSTIEELQATEAGTTEYPLVVTIIEIIDHVVVIFFTVEYFIRKSLQRISTGRLSICLQKSLNRSGLFA